MIKYPSRRLRQNTVIEIDDLNQDFQEIAEELTGNLNEHNFASEAIADLFLSAPSNGCRLYQSEIVSTDPSGLTASADRYDIPYDGAWHAIDDLSYEITTNDSVLYVIGCVQNVTTNAGNFFAIRIDGQIYPETITGSADLEQDRQQAPGPSLGTPERSYVSSPAMCQNTSIVIEGLIPVAAGPHIVEIVVMVAVANVYASAVDTRELIVLELVQAVP